MNLNKLMKQAQKMQEQMARTQAELEDKTVEVTAGGGKVTVVANGAGDVLSIKIAKEIVDPEDIEILEDLYPERRPASHRQRQRDGEQRDDENHRGHARPQRARDVGLSPDSPRVQLSSAGAGRKLKLREFPAPPFSQLIARNFPPVARANVHLTR